MARFKRRRSAGNGRGGKMVGAIIVTHANLGESLVEAAEAITGAIEKTRVLSVKTTDSTEAIRDRLAAAVDELDSGDGVIVFTDLFGGTPTNVALSLLEEDRVEVITGVNLPVLIKFTGHRSEKPLHELTLVLKEYGRSSIVLAGDMLKDREKE